MDLKDEQLKKNELLKINAKRNNLAGVKLLLSENADPTYEDRHGLSALLWAAEKGNWEIIETLLGAKGVTVNQVNKKSETILMRAAKYGHANIVKTLISRGANICITDAEGYSALMWAAEKGNYEVVEILLQDKKVDINLPNEDGWTALMLAAFFNKIKITELLISKGATNNYKTKSDYNALMCAATMGNSEIVQILLNASKIKKNIDIKEIETALISAAESNHADVVKTLLAIGANSNCKDKYGDTVLLLAAERNNLEVVQTLLEADDIQINMSNTKNLSPLMLAAKHGHPNIAKTLIAKGANINQISYEDKTALFYLIENGPIARRDYFKSDDNRLEILNELLANGVNVNFKDNKGRTALHDTCSYQNVLLKKNLENFINCQNFIQQNITYNISELNSIIEQNTIDDRLKETKIFHCLKIYDEVLENKCLEYEISNVKVKKFLKLEFLDNLKFTNNYSLLHMALLNNMDNLTSELINIGVDTNHKDSANLTVWHHACKMLNPKVAFALRSSNYELNEGDKKFLQEFKNLELTTNEECLETNLVEVKDNSNLNLILSYYDLTLENQIDNITSQSFTQLPSLMM